MKHFLSKVKKSCKRFVTGKSGFSLVELIVVIAIMAVMAAVLAPALLGYVERSRSQKDSSAMGEVTNAIQLSLADQNVYDELLPYTVKDNFSCYADGDTSTNTDDNKIITKSPDYWLFNDEARKLDETPYQPAGSMRGVTITLKPNGSAEYILKDGIINQTGDSSTSKGTITGKTLNDAPAVYNRLRSTVGDTIKVSSQTYRNSTYTIFISMGTTGGNQADKQDAIQVYGQYNGTNLPEVMTATGSATQDKGNAGSNNDDDMNNGNDMPTNIITIKIVIGDATGDLVSIDTPSGKPNMRDLNGIQTNLNEQWPNNIVQLDYWNPDTGAHNPIFDILNIDPSTITHEQAIELIKPIREAGSDCNQDGVLDQADVQCLKTYLLNFNETSDQTGSIEQIKDFDFVIPDWAMQAQ